MSKELLARHRAVMPDWMALYYDEPLELVFRDVGDAEGGHLLVTRQARIPSGLASGILWGSPYRFPRLPGLDLPEQHPAPLDGAGLLPVSPERPGRRPRSDLRVAARNAEAHRDHWRTTSRVLSTNSCASGSGRPSHSR